jgi:hypothetical protein
MPITVRPSAEVDMMIDSRTHRMCTNRSRILAIPL